MESERTQQINFTLRDKPHNQPLPIRAIVILRIISIFLRINKFKY